MVHMVHSTTSHRLSEVIAAAVEEADVTLRRLEDSTGIARTTLKRRLDKGGWTIAELEALAPILGTSVVTLLEQAERGDAA